MICFRSIDIVHSNWFGFVFYWKMSFNLSKFSSLFINLFINLQSNSIVGIIQIFNRLQWILPIFFFRYVNTKRIDSHTIVHTSCCDRDIEKLAFFYFSVVATSKLNLFFSLLCPHLSALIDINFKWFEQEVEVSMKCCCEMLVLVSDFAFLSLSLFSL